MSQSSRPRILVAIDLDEHAQRVIDVAAELATQIDGDLTLVHVHDRGFDLDREGAERHLLEEEAQDQGNMLLLVERLLERGLDVSGHVVGGAPIEVILQMAESQRAAYLVIGVNPRGFLYEALVGSVSRTLLESARCPVVSVPPLYGEAPPAES